jgi:septum formation protein
MSDGKIQRLPAGKNSMHSGKRPVILASASPRRAELLAAAGIEFSVIPADICEDQLPGERATEHVERLSREKARAVAIAAEGHLFIGADTVVVLDGRIMGKPVDELDAFDMLLSLSGRTHEVITGFTILDKETGNCFNSSVLTEVTFRILEEEEIRQYIASGCPMDKAGAYAIQGGAVHFVRSISGSYSNVVGLPMAELCEALISIAASGNASA